MYSVHCGITQEEVTNLPVKKLPKLTKTMRKSEEKWRNNNWNKTIEKHTIEIEGMLARLSVLDIWSNALQKNETAKILIPEIFMDGYVSIHFACYGLYKYAHICLRSELETTLRLIYFSTHEVEFEWWSDGSEWFRENGGGDVWGRGYRYFKQLETIKGFDKECGPRAKLFGKKKEGITGIYSTLSKYIHTGAGYFQTKPDKVSPIYKLGETRKWIDRFKKVQEYVNVILPLGFPAQFRRMTKANGDKVSKIGISSQSHRKALKKALDF